MCATTYASRPSRWLAGSAGYIPFYKVSRTSVTISVRPLADSPSCADQTGPADNAGPFLCWGLSGATAHAAFVPPLPQMDLCCGDGFGMPRTLKPLRIAARICTSATYRPKSRVERRWAIVGPSGGLALCHLRADFWNVRCLGGIK